MATETTKRIGLEEMTRSKVDPCRKRYPRPRKAAREEELRVTNRPDHRTEGIS